MAAINIGSYLVRDNGDGTFEIINTSNSQSILVDGNQMLIDTGNMNIKSTAPSSPSSGDMYIDDGTNTASGNLSLRIYDGTSWVDQN